MLIGGDGQRTLARVVAYGDEWMPIGGFRSPESLERRIDELRQLAASAGRAEIPVTVFGAAARPDQIEALAAMGVSRAVFWLPPAEAEVVMPRLRRCAEAASL